jgi:predicted NBD/HSP70 family sugar kinase
VARDGEREVIARLELPLPVTLASEVMRAVAEAVTGQGYTDVVFLTDGTGRIAATPPRAGG